MVFSSALFLLYFIPFFLLVYYIIPRKFKNLFIVLSSIIFYAWGAPKIIFIVLISIVLDFVLVRFINTSQPKQRKIGLVAALIINLSFLFYYKYTNFFIDNINTVLASAGFKSIEFVRIALPIGISFFTFQKMSYIIDVYRKVKEPMKKIEDYALYILFFPQLIAGPILRFNEIADQIIDRKANDTIDNKLTGFFRFIIGLSKKVLIANVLGAEADKIFAMEYSGMSTLTAWAGILAYTFQIYFDFAGYSDMAIGLARMMGFKFPENFNNPYISQSITEFWRRWHITLSMWMRDYLYIPLGGNRYGTYRMFLNLWLVFLLSGLWHGAAWNFVVWGSFHGFFLICDKLFLLKFFKRIGKYPSIFITFFITIIGWCFFRIEDLELSKQFIYRLLAFDFREISYYIDARFWTMLCVAVFFSFITAFENGKKIENAFYATKYNLLGYYVMTILCAILLIISLSYIASSGFNPFIYFRF